jgi:4-hydroxymandelate oxidase
MESNRTLTARRKFLGFLLASPILACSGVATRLVEELLEQPLAAQLPRASLPQHEYNLHPGDDVVIRSVKEAITVMDFYAYIHAKFPPESHVRYTGDFYNETIRANIDGFLKYQIRKRFMTGINQIDMSVQFLGKKWESPIYLCPGGGNDGDYPNGHVVLARAAKVTGTLLIRGAPNLDAINVARGEPVWGNLQGPAVFQPGAVKRFADAGCPVFVWTIDNVGGANMPGSVMAQRLHMVDLSKEDDPRCNSCHKVARARIHLSDPMSVIGQIGAYRVDGPRPTWDDIKRVRDMTGKMKLVLKGIVTAEDAALAVQNGIDAIMVSTHGGDEDNGGRGAIESLPEVAKEVDGRIPVLFDSGIRSGVDVFKALALGATAVGVAHAHHWALASFGQEGVETMIAILRRELQATMAQTGSPSIAKIRRDMLATRS